MTTANVARLQPVWVVSTGVTNGHEAPPIVNNGVMFVATPGNQVIALDARTGALLWRYKRPSADDVVLLHGTSRGVALAGDKLFFAAAEAVLVAIDARSRQGSLDRNRRAKSNGYYMSLAPLVADGKVMVGASGGEMGVRGFVAAYDLDSGKQVWKTYTVPAPGEPGSETWPKGDQWKTGGGSVWVTGNIRSRDQSGVLGDRQRRPVDGRPAARRQPVHLVHDRARRRHRRDQGPLPIPPQRFLGLGRGVAADSG